MDSERAWISARPAIMSPELRALWEHGDLPPITMPWVHLFPVRFVNSGKSPAQIDEIAIRYVLLEKLSDLKEEPEYGEAAPQDGYMLVPREKVVLTVPLTEGTDGGTLTKFQLSAVIGARSFLYGYGFVGYRDVYGRHHITRFGYVYRFPQGGAISYLSNEFMRDGPPAYNQAT